MEIKDYLKEKKEAVDKVLDELLPDASVYPQSIHEAMRYSVFAGGKRLRPILTIAAAEACGGKYDNVIKAACAFELIHTYTLIHDDLPAMDNDDYRRGKLTCHKVFGDATAILAGDALLTSAFEILASKGISTAADDSSKLETILLITKAIGSQGLIGGQVIDLESNNENSDKNILNYIHKNKTAALFQAAVKTGGKLVEADENMISALNDFATHFGLAFQITDDILDIEGESAAIGKSTGSDEKNKKLTYPALYGLEESKKMAQESSQKAINSLKIFGDKAQVLEDITYYTLHRSF